MIRIQIVGAGVYRRLAKAKHNDKGDRILTAASVSTGTIHAIEIDGKTACGRVPEVNTRLWGHYRWAHSMKPVSSLTCSICARRWGEDRREHKVEGNPDHMEAVAKWRELAKASEKMREIKVQGMVADGRLEPIQSRAS